MRDDGWNDRSADWTSPRPGISLNPLQLCIGEETMRVVEALCEEREHDASSRREKQKGHPHRVCDIVGDTVRALPSIGSCGKHNKRQEIRREPSTTSTVATKNSHHNKRKAESETGKCKVNCCTVKRLSTRKEKEKKGQAR